MLTAGAVNQSRRRGRNRTLGPGTWATGRDRGPPREGMIFSCGPREKRKDSRTRVAHEPGPFARGCTRTGGSGTTVGEGGAVSR